MTLMRRPQSRGTVPLQAVLDRLAGDWPSPMERGMADVLPALDVRETDDSYVIELDLPGIDPEKAEVLVEGRTVTIRGTMVEERDEERSNYLVRERRQGAFLRAVALPEMIDVDQVSTRYENGELTIALPKASGSRARRIAIGSGSSKAAEGSLDAGAKRGSASQPNGSRGSGAANDSKRSTAAAAAPNAASRSTTGG
jgi:HSP20 family protein